MRIHPKQSFRGRDERQNRVHLKFREHPSTFETTMLDIKLIRENPDLVRAAIAAKHSEDVVDQILEFDRERRAIIGQVEVLKSKRNTVSEEIAKLKRAKEPAEGRIAEMKAVGDKIAALDGELREKELAL